MSDLGPEGYRVGTYPVSDDLSGEYPSLEGAHELPVPTIVISDRGGASRNSQQLDEIDLCGDCDVI